MKEVSEVFEQIHLIPSLTIAFLTNVFGAHWILFAGYLLLNVIDFHTGREKARHNNQLESNIGWRGIRKKVMLWIIVVLGFLASVMLIELGIIVHMDFGITIVLGYLVLGSLIINEFNSIIENFVEMDYEVPKVLTRGLKVADEKINGETKE